MKTVRLLLPILFLLFCGGRAAAQNCPPNLGFEMGNWTGWKSHFGEAVLQDGINSPVWSLRDGLPSFATQDLFWRGNVNELDPIGKFPVICPWGGEYTARVGDDANVQEAHNLHYDFVVPNDSFKLTLYYAVVLGTDSRDASGTEARMAIRVTDLEIDQQPPCGEFSISYERYSGQWKAVGGNYYKPWTALTVDLRNRAGRRFRVDVTVLDCAYRPPTTQPPHRGHMCYAYIDFAPNCREQNGSANVCQGADSTLLEAPKGFGTYTWWNANYTAIVGSGNPLVLRPVPPIGTQFHCDLEPVNSFFGCRDTLHVTVKASPLPDTVKGPNRFYYCLNQRASPLLLVPDPGTYLEWWTGPTGGTPSLSPPFPPTNALRVITYWVSQRRSLGCSGPRKPVYVEIRNPEPLRFTVNALRQCLDQNRFVFTNVTPIMGTGSFYWQFNDEPMQLSDSNYLVKFFDTAGTVRVRLMLLGTGACSGRADTSIVVVPRPKAGIRVPGGYCFDAPAVTFADASQTTGASIAQFWWNINGQQYTTPTVTLPATGNGAITVQHSSVSVEGCRSDTITKTFEKAFRPLAAFSWNGHCDNEPVAFRDASFYAPGVVAPPIAGWQWLFDNTLIDTVQHPGLILASGDHVISLIAVGGSGCESPRLDTPIHIDPSPQLSFTYDDSCARRDIHFSARDALGGAGNWAWDFGVGRVSGGTTMAQRFLTAGWHRVQVFASNGFGCKDTFTRDVPVFEVRALAPPDTLAAINQSVQLLVQGDSGTRYTWSPPLGLSDPAAASPVAVLDVDQRYTLTAVDTLGCDRVSTVLIRRFRGPELYIPNAFSPNADGRNDRLRVITVGVRTFNFLEIYDRWGRLVFRTTDPNYGWDGSFNGQALGTASFVYQAEAIDINGNRLYKKGTVTLVR